MSFYKSPRPVKERMGVCVCVFSRGGPSRQPLGGARASALCGVKFCDDDDDDDV